MPHSRSIGRIVLPVLAFLFQQSAATRSPNARALRNRATNITKYGEINVTGFPSCAVSNCITSNQLSPSRLGCNGTALLTTDCLCSEAPTPLQCVPSVPSDEENCWYDAEDWFAGVCSGVGVPEIKASTMPQCMQTCMFTQLSTMGCHNPTRNCFCILDRNPLLEAASNCLTGNCAEKMQSSFSPDVWRESICKVGEANDYDQAGYDKYVKMAHDTKIAVPVVVIIVWLPATATLLSLTGRSLWIIPITTIIALAIILPVEFAL